MRSPVGGVGLSSQSLELDGLSTDGDLTIQGDKAGERPAPPLLIVARAEAPRATGVVAAVDLAVFSSCRCGDWCRCRASGLEALGEGLESGLELFRCDAGWSLCGTRSSLECAQAGLKCVELVLELPEPVLGSGQPIYQLLQTICCTTDLTSEGVQQVPHLLKVSAGGDLTSVEGLIDDVLDGSTKCRQKCVGEGRCYEVAGCAHLLAPRYSKLAKYGMSETLSIQG